MAIEQHAMPHKITIFVILSRNLVVRTKYLFSIMEQKLNDPYKDKKKCSSTEFSIYIKHVTNYVTNIPKSSCTQKLKSTKKMRHAIFLIGSQSSFEIKS